MTVRQATIKDLDQLSILFDGYRIFYRKESDINAATEFLKKRIEEKSSVIFVVENTDQQLVAFTQLYPLFSSTQMKRFWLLNDLFVAKDARGKGLSKLLIERVKEYSRETNSTGFFLETEISNEIGNRLYERIGMTLDKEHNYFFWSC